MCVFRRFSIHVQLRPGGHDTLPAKPIDVSAFSYSKRTAHQSPLSFLKRGTGNGGTVIPFGSSEDSSASGQSSKGGGAVRASAKRAEVVKKTKLRDFQVTCLPVPHGQQENTQHCTRFPYMPKYIPGTRMYLLPSGDSRYLAPPFAFLVH